MTARRTLVTGASRGTGYSLAGRLAGPGHEPAGLARPAPAAFPGESREAGLAGRRATGAALEKVLSGGPVDAVVSNAGLGRAGMTGAVDLGDLAGPCDLNARAAVQVTQAALPSMRARGRGRVVNVSSMVTVGLVDRTAHGAAKAAPGFCSRAWANDLGPAGITVNPVAPGPKETACRTRPATSPARRCALTAAAASAGRERADARRRDEPGADTGPGRRPDDLGGRLSAEWPTLCSSTEPWLSSPKSRVSTSKTSIP